MSKQKLSKREKVAQREHEFCRKLYAKCRYGKTFADIVVSNGGRPRIVRIAR